jgi:GH15 family glucan-1,4-alpha-glucosidase
MPTAGILWFMDVFGRDSIIASLQTMAVYHEFARGTLVRLAQLQATELTDINNPQPNENPNQGTLLISSQLPGEPAEFPAKEIVDGGFLQLVRYGIRSPNDPIIVDSVKVIDAVLKVDTPAGPCWHRYNHDGYGQ